MQTLVAGFPVIKWFKQEICHNVTYAPKDNFFSRIEARGQGHRDPMTVCDTQRPQGVSSHQIWDPYLKQYWRYASDTIFLELKPEVMDPKIVCNTQDPKVYPHIKFGIPTSNDIGDMLRTRIRLGRTDTQFKNYMPQISRLCGHKKLSNEIHTKTWWNSSLINVRGWDF